MNYPEELTKTYEIYEEIGAGGGGTVYRAVHKRLNKTVVLKKLKGVPGSLLESRKEVDILKDLRHSYLPQVLDFIESSEGIFTVMDFIPGKSLQKLLEEGHVFTEKEVLKYAKQLCEALAYLHAQNPPIVHGDIKPDNIMVTPEGNICLIDFNISGVLEGGGMQTFGYTPGYSSPEQVRAFKELSAQLKKARQMEKKQSEEQAAQEATVLLADAGEEKTELLQEVKEESVLKEEPERKQYLLSGGKIDKRSDIYSLGATLYTLLTSKLFEGGKKQKDIPQVSDGLLLILNKALEQKPEKRYPDAEKMLQAILQVHKKDKKYRRMLVKQELTVVFLLVLIAGSVFLGAEGKRKLVQERKEQYEALVEQMGRATGDGVAYEDFEALYEQALALQPDYLEAYYEKAYYLFCYESEEDAMTYIEEVWELQTEGKPETERNLYHVYAECCFRQEEYEDAEFYYKRAIRTLDDNPNLYRDYAISLVYLNKADKAGEVLEKAVSMGMAQADIYMVQGEIERMSGNLENAISCFEGVLKESEESYLRQRAYIMASRAFEEMGTLTALLTDVTWLEQAAGELAQDSRLLVYERLVKDYIAIGEQTKENAYYQEAIRVLEKIMEMRWDTVQTYGNAVILSQRMGAFEQAERFTQSMRERYPEHYMTYVRLAYLELELQNAKERDERDYHTFAQYYEQAKSYYKEQVTGNVTNAEIQLLDTLYQEVVSGGWLE